MQKERVYKTYIFIYTLNKNKDLLKKDRRQGDKKMNNTQTTNKKYNFDVELQNDFTNKNFKDDYVLSIRLSYGEDKQKDNLYNDYISFLKNDLKIINDKNEIEVNSKKANSYYFIFKKTSEYDNYFSQLQNYIDTNKDNKKVSESTCYKKYANLLIAENDLYNENFTISNYELTKNKVLNFINHCLKLNLIERQKK